MTAAPVSGRDGSLTAFFGDGTKLFRLDIGAIRRLEDSRRIGIFAVHERLMTRQCFFADLVEILRHGLIGGGLGAAEAARLVDGYADPKVTPLIELYVLALSVMNAAILVPEGAPPGKAEAGEADAAPPPPNPT